MSVPTYRLNLRNDYKGVLRRPTTPQRKEEQQWYARKPWLLIRRAYLQEHPTCEQCGRQPAKQVHHRVSRKAAPELALEWSNLQALCPSCHSRITARR